MCHPFRQERRRSRNIQNIPSRQTETRKTIFFFIINLQKIPHHTMFKFPLSSGQLQALSSLNTRKIMYVTYTHASLSIYFYKKLPE